MKTKSIALALILLILLLVACGPAATTAAPAYYAPATQAPATAAPAENAYSYAAPTPAAVQAAPQSDNGSGGTGVTVPQTVEYGVGGGKTVANIQSASRMIIKNAELTLQVKNVDAAVDGVTQVVGDLGAYIISSRVWYQDTNGENMKYSTITLGVPVEQFESMLRRLRGLSMKVLDENATGEDVTDQFVDLQSQLQNLQATRDRLRDFLKSAKNVDEALKVNQELTNIEGQIEEIQGRMNYLQNRSAYSTITVTLQPVPPQFTPTPTATATPTRTPTVTSTPVPWKPGETFNSAGTSLSTAYKGIADTLIWVVVFIVPIVLPAALIVWGIWAVARRKSNKQKLAGSLEK
jgi:hypothetical protein